MEMSEDEVFLMEMEREEDMTLRPIKSKREKPKSKPPTICPLLTIACAENDVFTDCVKEQCWFYNRHLKVCAVVHIGMSLGMMVTHQQGKLAQSILEDLKKKP